MDELLISLANFSETLIPILRAVVLLCVIILLVKIIKVMANLNVTLDKSNTTIDLLDESIEKVQAPLDTAVKLSKSVDKAYDTTVKVIDSTKDFVEKNAGDIKDKLISVIKSDKKTIKQENVE